MNVEIENKVIDVLAKVLNTSVTRDQLLLSTGTIDSMSLLEVMMGLESAFDITLEPMEISPTTFDSVAQISTMIQSKIS